MGDFAAIKLPAHLCPVEPVGLRFFICKPNSTAGDGDLFAQDLEFHSLIHKSKDAAVAGKSNREREYCAAKRPNVSGHSAELGIGRPGFQRANHKLEVIDILADIRCKSEVAGHPAEWGPRGGRRIAKFRLVFMSRNKAGLKIIAK